MREMNLFGKKVKKREEVVVITGASAGVGRATAREFAKHGAKVALLARGEEALQNTKREVEELGGKAMIYCVDVADPKKIEQAADEVERQFGPIDVWVNNAMTSVFSPVKEMEGEEYKRVTEVTFLGQVYGALAALKKMLPRDRGSIIFVGSALAYRGIPLQSAYCASKHAIVGFFDSLRAELYHDKSKVKVTTVNLPALNTPQFNWVKSRLPMKPKPMGGDIFQPEVAARAIYYAAHHNRREINVGFSTIQTIVGNKIAPWFLDRFLGKKGVQGQQTDQPAADDRKFNLWEPVPGDFGAHGDFDKQAQSFSLQNWANLHLKELAISAVGIGAGVSAFAFRNKIKEAVS